ncbi:MAG TPA: M14 family metallocarboxypeptidase [Burkholderiales bacterium]|nr:M14 family metallocarboxypeptidase [Burkholderiales bacterium]
MRTGPRYWLPWFAFLCFAAPPPAAAQCAQGEEYRQSEAVRARYPDPPVRLTTPAFAPGKTDFTTHEEMMRFVRDLARQSASLHVRIAGHSQEGREIPALVLSNSGHTRAADLKRLNRPVVFLMGQVHGNEPAGGEAMLAVAQALAAGELKPLLDRVTVVIFPRANPDGAHHFWRSTANCVDINRDHVKAALPETAALRAVMNEFQPEVFADAHEFSVATRWIEKFGLIQSYDFVMQYATNPNVPAALTAIAEQLYRRNLVRDVEQAGYTHFWYYTTSYDVKDKRVAMGGTIPDIGRNYASLQNAISFLIENRGVGIGRESYARRVHTQYTVMASLLNTTAANAAEVLKVTRAVREDVIRRGREPAEADTVAVTTNTPITRQKLTMMDPGSGELKEVEVEWSDSLGVKPALVRRRPWAYLMPPSFQDVARRMALSGVEVRRLKRPVELEVESYEVVERRAGDTFLEGHIRSTVKTEVAVRRKAFPAGSYVYLMAQPNANVIAIAMEPESPSSFVAWGFVPTDRRGLANPQDGAPSEVPVYRVLRPVELETVAVEGR